MRGPTQSACRASSTRLAKGRAEGPWQPPGAGVRVCTQSRPVAAPAACPGACCGARARGGVRAVCVTGCFLAACSVEGGGAPQQMPLHTSPGDIARGWLPVPNAKEGRPGADHISRPQRCGSLAAACAVRGSVQEVSGESMLLVHRSGMRAAGASRQANRPAAIGRNYAHTHAHARAL